jgi:rRNA-processing protein FCF1
MRHGRAKQARRTLQFFRLNVGIQAPFHVVLDGCFLVAMISQKVPLKDRLSRLLQHSPCTVYVTRSALDELHHLHTQTQKDVFREARQWGLDECDIIEPDMIVKHKGTKKGKTSDDDDNDDDEQDVEQDDLGKAGRDILTLALQAKEFSHPKQPPKQQQQQQHHHPPKHYFVASQDETLLNTLRSLGTVPCIRLSRGVLLLENPSKASQNKAAKQERIKWRRGTVGDMNPKERSFVEQIQKEDREQRKEAHKLQQQKLLQQQQQQQPYDHHYERRKSTKPRAPNPLSCKKKRTDETTTTTAKKRKRRRKNNKEES